MLSNLIVQFLIGLCVFGIFVRADETPEIVQHPTDAITVEGSDVILRCVVENLPLENDLVQWTKDGFALGYDRDIPGFRTYSMIGDISIGEYNLLIENATLNDEGEYECQVRVDRMRTVASVTILVPPQGPAIEDADGNDVIDVLAYTDNLITCRSWGGKPAGKLSWYKDGVKVEENVTYAETLTNEKLRNSSATMRLWPTEDDDGDVYECIMTVDEVFQGTTVAGHVSTRSVELNVQKPPVASLSISPNEVKEGRNLFARCDAFSSKPPAKSYIWYLGDDVLKGKENPTLAIYNINRTLNGAQLGCRAVNDIGQSEISQFTLNVLYAPTSVAAPKDVVTNVSAIVNMSCAWDSNPLALITWYKRGNVDTIVGEGEELMIQVEDQSAAGVYVCVADARGVASKSASARLDVLGPPIFNSPTTQQVPINGKAMVNCSLGSTPGISHVTWSWIRKGTVMALENNETRNHENKVKYIGVMNYGQQTASLIINDATPDDMSQYNCTVHNPYGTRATTITLEEQSSPTMAMMIPMIGAIIGGVVIILVLGLIGVFCVRRKKHQKSTTFPPEKESLGVQYTDGPREDNRTDLIPASAKLISHDADSDNPSTSASMSSRDVARDHLDDFRGCSAHNDDGYHTEANSWNRNEKQSPGSSPARSTREEYHQRSSFVPPMPLTSSPRGVTSPYASSDMASDLGNNDYLKYNLQPPQTYNPYPVQYGPNGMVELPPVRRAASPMNMYGMQQPQYPSHYYQGPSSSSSGYRSVAGYPVGPQRPRVGSNAPSLVSSHRSVTPSPAYVAMLGRATPTSVLGDRAMYPVPINSQSQIRPSSSQSSLDQAASSVTAQDPYENPSKMSQLSSRISQASRSSELLNKPMTARMATHV